MTGFQLKRFIRYVKPAHGLCLWEKVFPSKIPPFIWTSTVLRIWQGSYYLQEPFWNICAFDFRRWEHVPFSWASKWQTAVARSTTKAELAAANEGAFQDGIRLSPPFPTLSASFTWSRPPGLGSLLCRRAHNFSLGLPLLERLEIPVDLGSNFGWAREPQVSGYIGLGLRTWHFKSKREESWWKDMTALAENLKRSGMRSDRNHVYSFEM